MLKVPFNFCGLPKEYSDYSKAAIVILQVPFDKTSTWGKGADKGPRAIIDASRNLELYDIETGSEVCEKGIATLKPISAATVEKLVDATYKRVRELLADKKFVVTLGGEHSVSIGPIKAHAEAFRDISILHLDAHGDRRDFYMGSKYNHACVIARVREFTENIVSVGIRSMDSSELKLVERDKIFYAHEIYNSEDWIPNVVEKLTDNVYITIDLDVFDPSIMPSTGTPEPGGLGWYQVDHLLKAVTERRNVLGFDIVELAPVKTDRAPDFLAAKLVYKLLSYKFAPHANHPRL
ncbi:MAG: agmatinase [Candidatus Bilamarchaeaceae archaeon]